MANLEFGATLYQQVCRERVFWGRHLVVDSGDCELDDGEWLIAADRNPIPIHQLGRFELIGGFDWNWAVPKRSQYEGGGID